MPEISEIRTIDVTSTPINNKTVNREEQSLISLNDRKYNVSRVVVAKKEDADEFVTAKFKQNKEDGKMMGILSSVPILGGAIYGAATKRSFYGATIWGVVGVAVGTCAVVAYNLLKKNDLNSNFIAKHADNICEKTPDADTNITNTEITKFSNVVVGPLSTDKKRTVSLTLFKNGLMQQRNTSLDDKDSLKFLETLNKEKKKNNIFAVLPLGTAILGALIGNCFKSASKIGKKAPLIGGALGLASGVAADYVYLKYNKVKTSEDIINEIVNQKTKTAPTQEV